MKFLKIIRRKRFLAVICVSLLLHFFVGIFYGGYVLFEKFDPPEPTLVAPPISQGIEPIKKEYKIKMEKSQKQSAAPLPIPIVSNIPSNLSLDNIDLNVSTPRSDSRVRGIDSGDGVGNGFGDGFGSGAGFAMDIDISFFGAKGGGRHVAFVVDFSASMNGEKEPILRRELHRVLGELPDGVNFGAIFFAGPAWPAEKGVDPNSNNWVWSPDDYSSFRPKRWSRLPDVRYSESSPGTRRRYQRYAENTPLELGTVYDVPIYMALKMDPIPETIFFMTDGACSERRGIDQLRIMMEQLNALGKKMPVIHTVGLGIPDSNHLREIASLTGGTATFLTVQQYIREYGEAEVDLFRDNIQVVVEEVDEDEYPPVFELE